MTEPSRYIQDPAAFPSDEEQVKLKGLLADIAKHRPLTLVSEAIGIVTAQKQDRRLTRAQGRLIYTVSGRIKE